MQQLLLWIQSHPQLLTLALATSVLLLVVTVILAPQLAALIPEDYFSNPQRRTLHPRNLLFRLLRKVAKNLLGLCLLVLGLVMLVTPGQGVLTIFVALLALDYPGKYRLERRLVSITPICRGINWLRARAGAPPLLLEPEKP